MLTDHQRRTLRKLLDSGLGWTPAAMVTRASQETWNSLATLGFVEVKREEQSGQLLVCLTEKGRHAADGEPY